MIRPGTLTVGWAVALSAVGALAVLAVIPPALGGDAGAMLHHAFAAVCHQMPERSLHLHGGPIALCHRCSGILVGLLVGLAALPGLGVSVARGIARGAQIQWLVLAALPTAADWAVGALGIWANTPASRLLTGALFGLVAGAILGANLLAPTRAVPVSHPTPS